MFDTFGPYKLETYDKQGIDAFYQQLKRDPDGPAQVVDGVGVYVVAANDLQGELVPQYVGQTTTGFGRRLKQHFDSTGTFFELSESVPLTLILLARAENGQILTASEAAKNRNNDKAIDELEFALIGLCVKRNPDLKNKQEKTFHKMLHVPGYLDNGPTDRAFPAAQALARILKT